MLRKRVETAAAARYYLWGNGMSIETDLRQVSSCSRGGRISLELTLSRDVFSTAQRLSGVVVLRLKKPTNLWSLSISVEGRETPAWAGLSRALRGGTLFFSREVLLTGMEQPRATSERIGWFWNAFLGRDTGRRLTVGEHIYPFSIPLPASLPPTYRGRAGAIDYTVCARLRLGIGRVLRAARSAALVSPPCAGRTQPVALSYPTADGNVHTACVSASLQLPGRTVALGGKIAGRFALANAGRTPIRRVSVFLECCEWLQRGSRKQMYRRIADQYILDPADPRVQAVEAEFELAAPRDAPPTVEGSAISVIWLLKLRIDAEPPIELKTPVTAYEPALDPESGSTTAISDT
ncbi:MAG: hypothetical protein ACP5R5_01515 [Armatimonadota bacterium]